MLLHSSAEERSISTFFLRTILCNMAIFHRHSIYIQYTNIDEYINCYLLLLTKLYTLYSDNTLRIHCYIYSICADILLQGTIYCTFRFNPLVLKTQLLHMLARIANASILSRIMHHRNPSSVYKQIYVRSRANPLFVYSAVQNPVLIV